MQPGDIDANEVIAALADRQIDRLESRITGPASRAYAKFRSGFRSTYAAYLSRVLERYSKGKSFLFGTEPVPLEDFFVPLDLCSTQHRLPDADMQKLAAVAPHAVVLGTGGCGKSVLMRHLLVSVARTSGRIPIFFELRDLNDSAGAVDLEAALLTCVNHYGLGANIELLRAMLSSGNVCLLLDGFDEVGFKRRKSVIKAVNRLATRYPDIWVVLTSRPDADLNELADFVQFSIDPLTLPQAVDLVSRLPFDPALKSSFVRDLEDELYERHTSFLSNPLLLSIMLLTYQDAAHIPNKLNLFYAGAYEALFQKHDARKGAYTRERHTQLDMQDFARVFSGFSLVTYDRRQFTFSRVQALDMLDAIANLAPIRAEYTCEDYLDDCIQAVCLLVEDGLSLTFTHRSFQEYFAARYIAAAPDELKKKLISKYTAEMGADTVITLLWEMDREAVEKYYLVPTIHELREKIGCKRKVGITHFLKYLRLVWEDMTVLPEDDNSLYLFTTDEVRYWHLLFFLDRTYLCRGDREDRKLKDGDDREVVRLVRDRIEGADDRIPLAALRTTDPIVVALAGEERTLSLKGLQRVMDLADEMEKGHQAVAASVLAM